MFSLGIKRDVVRGTLWAGLVVSVLASAYSILSLVMVASLSGAPNYPLERAQYNQRVWLMALVAALLVGIICAMFLVRSRRWFAR